MGRDFWQTVREALRVDKIKQQLIVPAGIFNCCFDRASVLQVGTVSPIVLASNITLSSTAVTIDFWAKIIPTSVASYDVFALVDSGATREIRMSINQTTGLITISAITSTSSYSFTVSNQYFHSWHRFTVTFSTANTIMKLYVDAVFVGSVVIAGNLTNSAFSFVFGQASFLNLTNAYLNELALYSQEQTEEEIKQTNSFKANIGAYGQTLVGYWKMNDATGSPGNLLPSVGAINLSAFAGNPGQSRQDSDYAPIKFGSSFVAVQYDVALGYKTSVQFPRTIPSGMTGMIVLRWVDDDGVIQRRKLWDLAGVDIGPIPATYRGERLAENFTVEIWNIDGNETVVIPSSITLRIAKCTNPQTSYDATAVTGVTITADSTLAASPYPLTFPITFNTQQTY